MDDRLESWARRHSLQVLLSLGFCAALLYALTFYPELTGTDDTTYLVASRALASGQGLHWIHVVGNPPITFQPPGYPILLIPASLLFPEPPGLTVAAQIIGILSALAFIPAVYLVLTRMMRLESISAILITAWMAVSTITVDLAAQKIMSDPAYVLFSIVAILAIERYRQSSKTFGLWLILSAAATAWTATLRTAGLPLWPAAVGHLIFQRRPRQAVALFILVGLFLLPWTIWTTINGDTPYFGVYGEQFLMNRWLEDPRPVSGPAAIVERVFTNAWEHVRVSMGYALFPTVHGPNVERWLLSHGLGWIGVGIGLTFSTMALVGYVWSSRRGLAIINLYVIIYLGLILLAPWVTYRNIYPLYPFLLGYAVLGVQWIATHWKPERRRWAVWVPRLVVCLMILSALVSNRHRVLAAREFWSTGHSSWSVKDWSMPEAAIWIRENTLPDDLVYYQSTQKMFLYTGRRTATRVGSLPYQLAQLSPEDLAQRIIEDIDYVVIVEKYDWNPELATRVSTDPAHFSLVFQTSSTPGLSIYEVRR